MHTENTNKYMKNEDTNWKLIKSYALLIAACSLWRAELIFSVKQAEIILPKSYNTFRTLSL